MRDTMKRNTLTMIIACLIVLFAFGGCGTEREYYEDIRIPLETKQGEIVIKEWSFLMGSGAEVYYGEGDKEILLGKLLGGDDGFCPFKEGLYSVSADDCEVTLEWCRFPSDKDKPWEKETFTLPSD